MGYSAYKRENLLEVLFVPHGRRSIDQESKVQNNYKDKIKNNIDQITKQYIRGLLINEEALY